MADKWVYNDCEEGVWGNSEEYDSKEEAIKDGLEEAKERDWSNLFIAKADYVPVKIIIHADRIIEDTAEGIDCNYGCAELEFGQSFIEAISDSDTELLQKMLNETAEKWLKEIKYEPHMFICKDVEQIPLPEEHQ